MHSENNNRYSTTLSLTDLGSEFADLSKSLIKTKNYIVERWRREYSQEFFNKNKHIHDVFLMLPDGNKEWIAASDETDWDWGF